MKTILLGLILLGFAGSAWAVEPAELDSRIRKLTMKFEEMQAKPDKKIPADMLHKARGIVLLDRTKAGVVFAYQGGSGLAMVRDPKTDEWSPVAFLSANQASLGFQIGGEQDLYVVLLMTTNSTRVLTEPNFEFGGEARGTAGDASAGADGTINTHEQPVLVYSDRKGLFGGASLKAGAISPDDDANRAYYREFVTMTDILFDHKVKSTEAATDLAKRLTRDSKAADLSKNSGN
jgi:lipid-binding SYLF domain-containing protein